MTEQLKTQGEVSLSADGGASIAPTAEQLAVADKILSEITRKTTLGTNGDLKTVHKSEHFNFMKHCLKEEFGPAMTNRMIARAQDVFIQGIMAFLMRGGIVTFIRFGTFAAITRAARQTSLFGKPKTVEQSTYLQFDAGKEAKALVQNATTTLPIGKLKKSLKGQTVAAGGEEESFPV